MLKILHLFTCCRLQHSKTVIKHDKLNIIHDPETPRQNVRKLNFIPNDEAIPITFKSNSSAGSPEFEIEFDEIVKQLDKLGTRSYLTKSDVALMSNQSSVYYNRDLEFDSISYTHSSSSEGLKNEPDNYSATLDGISSISKSNPVNSEIDFCRLDDQIILTTKIGDYARIEYSPVEDSETAA